MQQVDAGNSHHLRQLFSAGRLPCSLLVLPLPLLCRAHAWGRAGACGRRCSRSRGRLAAFHQGPTLAAAAAAARFPSLLLLLLPLVVRTGAGVAGRHQGCGDRGVRHVLALHIPEVGGGALIGVLLPHIHLCLKALQ